MEKKGFNVILFLFLVFFILLQSSLWGVDLNGDGFSLSADQGKYQIQYQGKTIVDVDNILFDYIVPEKVTLKKSALKSLSIELQFPATVDYRHRPEDTQSRKATLEITLLSKGFRFFCNPDWADQVTIVHNYLGDHFFGLSEPLYPDNQLSPDLTGSVINVEVKNEGRNVGENYATAYSAFYMSSYGYGSFFDSFASGQYTFNLQNQNKIHHDDGKLDWYIFVGENGTEIHQSYFEVIGKPKYIPVWGVGPIAWRDDNKGGKDEILDDIQKFTDLKIPLTGWFVDRPYSDGNHKWSKMNFSKKFENPGEWISKIRNHYGLEFMTWTSTATFGDEVFPVHLPNHYTYIDLTHKPSVKAFQDLLSRNQYQYGVKGHKMDRADEHFPLYASWADKSIGPRLRLNTYVYLFSKVHHEALQKYHGKDHFNFARAAIHRVQPYLSAIWGGDPRTNWDGFRANFANGIRCGFMGFPLWGSDVGGYLGDGYIPENLYIRWLQAGAFSGFFEIKLDGSGGDGEPRLPWMYDESFQEIYRTYCQERMELIPTLYSLANTADQNGVLMKPMTYQYLDDPKTWDMWDQYFLGDAILVAPIFTPSNQREIYLPEGEWIDYHNRSKIFKGNQTIDLTASLDQIPLFIKSNSLFVSGKIYAGNDRLWDSDSNYLVLSCFPGQSGDACTFDYMDLQDNNAVKQLQLSKKDKEIQLTAPALSLPCSVEIYSIQSPASVSLKDQSVKFKYDQNENKIVIPMPAGESIDLTLKFN